VYHKKVVEKHGKANIKIEIINADSERHAFALESALIRIMKRHEYNITNQSTGGEGGTSGYKHTEEAKAKIGKASKGNKHGLGLKTSDETKKKLSEVHKGNSHAKGYLHTKEAKEKIQLASLGRTHMIGKSLSEETKEKISAKSKEQWAKIRAGEIASPARVGNKKPRKPTEHYKNLAAEAQRKRRLAKKLADQSKHD
jgi:hypothetical protein